MGSTAEEEEARCFLSRFVEEFPVPVGPGVPLPLAPPSRPPTLDELRGDSLDLGLRLLAARKAPGSLAAALCEAAVSELLKSDLSPLHCPKDAQQQDGEQVLLLHSEPAQRLFFNKLREVGVAWHQRLPVLPEAPPLVPLCSAHAIRNSRRKMEDRHVALAHFNQLLGLQDGTARQYYAVFDGHGGMDAANYAATHLHVLLGQQGALASDPETAFKEAFTRTDHMFRGKARRERLRSGSTGVAVLLQGEALTVAWLGDSQALLVRGGQAVTLMDPHKPEREDERERIEGLGGCITFMGCWRVNGTYAVSRAIGDFDQKPYVSGDADCSSTRLTGNEDYVLLACDGFFDTVSSEEVPQLVLGALRKHREPLEGEEPQGEEPRGEGEEPRGLLGEDVARQLVAHAKAAGSSDNITVMVVFLRSPELLLVGGAQDSNSQDAQGQ
ncbi:protein phosphatase 1F [Osmerus mordax]|uniref:protein phosphatase 1F n=1 Tax=Osmerus mordax TaxID=8014 RepID=UPI00350F19E8